MRATDFASWLVIKRLEGHSQRQKLKYAWADFCREECGSLRGAGSRDAMKRPGEYVRVDNTGAIPAPLKDPEILMDLNRVMAVLPKKYRLVVKLLYRGYKMEEIALRFGVTESRVSQLFKEARAIAMSRLFPSPEVPQENDPTP